MARIHLFEISDQAWFPDVMRTALMGRLEFVARIGGHGEPIAEILSRAVDHSRTKQILDLGSGAGGPMVAAFQILYSERDDLELTLSDLYPNSEALAHAARSLPGAISVCESPIDASHVPPSRTGLRTLVNVFHHFRPAAARAILQDAVDAHQPILIVELLRRHPLIVLLTLFSWIGVLLTLPLIRPFRWSWLLWTYVIPVIPLAFTWDATISALRTYSEDELRRMVSSVDRHESYEWRFEQLWLSPSPISSLALLGTPREPS
jgi:hypothetical protein